MGVHRIDYKVSPEVDDEALNELFFESWDGHIERHFQGVLRHSLAYLCAFDRGRLIGFVNIAWDGGVHGFLLDTTVTPEYQRQGIGTELVRRAAEVAAERGLEWLHVDYEAHLDQFYRTCGFQTTKAGLINLKEFAT